jgi:hypothetical protein
MALLPIRAATQKASRRAATTGIQLSLPYFTGPVRIYLDGRLVDLVEVNKPNDTLTDSWTRVPAPWGYVVYEKYDRYIVKYDSENKRYYFNETATIEERRSFFHTWRLVATPGSHNLEVLYPYPTWHQSSSNAHYLVPYLISSTQVEVEDANIIAVSPSPPDAWTDFSPGVPQYAESADAICKNAGAPDTADLAAFERLYMGDPYARALRERPAPIHRGSRTVVTLALPPELGGTREFDGKQIEDIMGAIRADMGSRYMSLSENDIEGCSQRYPQFALSYRRAAELLRVIDAEMASFQALARQLSGHP